MKKEIDMVNGRLLPEMIRFAIPVILSGILQTLYNAADSLVVGRYDSSYALGAVGSVGSIVNMFLNIFMGLAVGVNVVVARYLGAGDTHKVKDTSDTAIVTALITGIIAGVLGFFLAEPIARIVKIDSEIIDMSVTYMKIFFIGMPFSSLYNFIAASLRGIGDTKNSMIALVVSGALNVVLNVIFVKYFRMGVAGVALATTISSAVSFVMIMIMLKKSRIGFSLKHITFDKKILKSMVEIGLPTSIQSCVFSVSNTMMVSAINSFGAAAAAGAAVEAQVESILYAAVNSITQTVTTFTSQNIGARKLNRINKVLANGLIISVAEVLVLTVFAYAFKDFVIELFAPGDADVAAFALVKFKMVILPYFTLSFMEMPSGVLKGMGAATSSMLMSIIGVCGIRFVWLLWLFPIFRTPEFLFLSYVVSWLVTASAYMIAYAIQKKKLVKTYSLS